MNDITLTNIDSEPRADSRDLAARLGNKHRHSIELVDRYLEKFERFGVVRFETAKPEKGSLGGRPERYALLNEDQSYFLLSLSRNTETVVDLKADLVAAFRRARDEASLESMFNMVLLPDAASWEKRFMDGFYEALGRMSGLPFDGHAKGTPALFARITRDWVYRVALDERVYQEAKDRCRPGEKIHQWLTPGALRAVELQLVNITALANACVDYQDFVARCMRAYEKTGQLRLIYPAAA
ncbi:P63C domain-containing protein [Halomonas elongata]|uniref:P63C domain-containing protein n=1 Tax=Halomonas elongata TaxID=2746 RepID=UPI00255B36B9|nr:P63C domain-containing protein [Halomonas elongata]MDL4860803.1 P63C domain-containing protein [Halomonas elongata]